MSKGGGISIGGGGSSANLGKSGSLGDKPSFGIRNVLAGAKRGEELAKSEAHKEAGKNIAKEIQR